CAELRAVWRDYLPRQDADEESIARAVDAWFQYIETHTYAWRMLFRETSGDPDVEAIHREVASESRTAMRSMFSGAVGVARLAGASEREAFELAWEPARAALQGLA